MSRTRTTPGRPHGPATSPGPQRRSAAVAFAGPCALALLTLLAVPGPVRASENARPYRLGPAPEDAPRRVVTLAPSLTETVLALGAADRLVGVSRYDAFPEVAALPRVGGYLDPNLEVILGLRPDLLVVEPSPGNREVVERLARMGIPVRVAPARTVDGVRAAIRAVAADLGLAEKGEQVVAGLDARLAAVKAAAARRPRPRVLLVYGHEPLVVAGPGSFGDELLRLVGAKNAAADASVPYPSYPLERIAVSRPDVIVDVVAHGARDARPRLWARMEALAGARMVRLEAAALLRPGPALGMGAERLLEAVHPGAAQGAP